MNTFNDQDFINELQSAPWDTIKIFDDTNHTLFIYAYINSWQTSAPEKFYQSYNTT